MITVFLGTISSVENVGSDQKFADGHARPPGDAMMNLSCGGMINKGAKQNNMCCTKLQIRVSVFHVLSVF